MVFTEQLNVCKVFGKFSITFILFLEQSNCFKLKGKFSSKKDFLI